MNATTVLGYYVTCDDALCADCAPEGFADGDYSQWPGIDGWAEPLAIFPDQESDTPTHCAQCGGLIPHALTPDGYAYVGERIADYLERADGSAEVLAQWAGQYPDAWDDLAGTPYGEATLHAYVVCALWSSYDESDPSGGRPMDDTYGPDDIAADAMAGMREDCARFAMANLADIGPMPAENLGHDFWLTRNHHGTGFWDRGLGERGERLTEATRPYGEASLYVGDDGGVYYE